jgi:hypothetical protein
MRMDRLMDFCSSNQRSLVVLWVSIFVVIVLLNLTYTHLYAMGTAMSTSGYWRYGNGRPLMDGYSSLVYVDPGARYALDDLNHTQITRDMPNRIAFCVTGQLSRLEINSKVLNIFIPNAEKGYEVHVFILLDNEVDKVKSTKNTKIISAFTMDGDDPYVKMNAEDLYKYIHDLIRSQQLEKDVHDRIHVNVRLEKPSKDHFVYDTRYVPMREVGKGVESASADHRFQNVMRQWNGIRDCVKWMYEHEYRYRIFFDLVVRLRDDTYAIDHWYLYPDIYRSVYTTSKYGGGEDGLNDHNYVIDRAHSRVFESFSEDYYFNKTLHNHFWGNPEHRIAQILAAYNVPVRLTTFCEQPLVPVRGVFNRSHWKIHPIYINVFTDECKHHEKHYKSITSNSNHLRSGSTSTSSSTNDQLCVCKHEWTHQLNEKVTPIEIGTVHSGSSNSNSNKHIHYQSVI